MNSQKRETVSAAVATIPLVEPTDRLALLFAEHHRRVLVAAYRITGSMADAEDVTQTVFLRIVNSDSIDVKNAGSYLYRSAINGALDLLRRRKAAATEPLDAAASLAKAGESPDTEISSNQLRELLRQAIGELAPRAAEMFTLRYLEGLQNREIAKLMKTSQAVVAVTLHQSRSRLKKRLSEFERGNR
jgi:RNA polymerase sigma-70 factor (ECF subfamily)